MTSSGSAPDNPGAVTAVAEHTDEAVGYRGPTACTVAGISYRQLDYWARTGLVVPSVRDASGSGTQRLYSFRDIVVLKVVKRLLDAGVSLQNIRKAIETLRQWGEDDLATMTLISDGTTVYECRSAEEVVEDRKSTRLNSSHLGISYAVFCLKKKKKKKIDNNHQKIQAAR